jgi:hypothetical protein
MHYGWTHRFLIYYRIDFSRLSIICGYSFPTKLNKTLREKKFCLWTNLLLQCITNTQHDLQLSETSNNYSVFFSKMRKLERLVPFRVWGAASKLWSKSCFRILGKPVCVGVSVCVCVRFTCHMLLVFREQVIDFHIMSLHTILWSNMKNHFMTHMNFHCLTRHLWL